MIDTSVAITGVEEDRFAVYGSAGALVLDRFRSSRLQPVPAARALDLGARLRAGARQLAAVPRLLFDAVSPPRENSFAVALAGFARAARGDGEWSGADLEDARRSLAVVAAAERSAASGAKIVLGEPSA